LTLLTNFNRLRPNYVADLVTWWGRQYGTSRKREWRTGPAESENRSMYGNSLYGNREIPGVTGCHPQSPGRPNARHVRAWEVGRRNIIDKANEQRCTITPTA